MRGWLRAPTALAMMALTCALAGCGNSSGGGRTRTASSNRSGGRTDSPRAGSRPLDTNRDANELVAEAVGRQAVLSSLAGDGVLSMTDPAQKLNHRVNAEVVASEGQRLRVSGNRMGVDAFDLLMYDDEVVFYDALGKKIYRGSMADLDNIRLPVRPDQILDQLLKPDTELAYRKWRPDAARRTDPSGTAAFVSEQGQTVRVLLDRRTGLLTRVEVMDRGGQPFMVKTLSQYRAVDKGGVRQAGAGGALVPTAMFAYVQRLEWPGEQRKVEFAFKRVVADAPLAVKDFELRFAKNAREYPLGQAGMDASALEVSMR